MNWYYKILGGHTHVRVFMNGGKCGDLVFQNEEFQRLLELNAQHCNAHRIPLVQKLVDETPELSNPPT